MEIIINNRHTRARAYLLDVFLVALLFFLALVRVIHSFILHQIISSSFQIQILYLRMIVIVALDVNSALVISSIDRIDVASANDN